MLITKAQYVDVIETEGARVYSFRASTGSVDRQNEIVDQSGWDLASYRANPVVLDSHKYDSIEDVIGRCTRVEVVNGVLECDIIFADTEKGELANELVNTGFLRSVSVGFRSMERKPGSPMIHTKAELLEISLVAVPANSEATRIRSIKADREDYQGIKWTPPSGVRSACRKGLDLYEDGRGGDGLVEETITWARRLASGQAITPDKAVKMSAWHARHASDRTPGWDEPGQEKPGYVAFLLWGGSAGRTWADGIVERMREQDEKQNSFDDIVGNNGSNADIEVPETVEKAGRVISSKNLSKLQMAMEAISEVIASVGNSEGPRAGEESCGPKKPRKMDIPADVEAALMRFVGGGNNG